ncbi:hypothetical protein ATN88_12635 [Enterovibrio coralii]|uniref:Peptidase S1 domain-containing protein n=2 Tax=Enterovibrio coralii TaxID=294935 RepID=A0A135I2U8_9GAMM|nr:hypothetical protein ATN88_12635 [Enterovibrio coralii]
MLLPLFGSLGTHLIYAAEIQPLIVNGSDVSISDAPWQVYLRGTNGASTVGCGGSIIADNYVLTAAHCLYAYSSYTFTVYAGNAEWRDGSQHVVTARYIHEDYDNTNLLNDIALVKISGTLPANTKAIQLVSEDNQTAFDNEAATNTQDNLTVTGWGTTTQNRQNAAERLQGTTMTGVADAVCYWNQDSNNNYSQQLADMTICANNDEEKGACTGDSGGPLVWKDPSHASDSDGGSRLIGVVSFTWVTECANTSYPDGFAEVSNYLSWISEKITASGGDGDSVTGGGTGGSGNGGALVGGGGSFPLLSLLMLVISSLSQRMKSPRKCPR